MERKRDVIPNLIACGLMGNVLYRTPGAMTGNLSGLLWAAGALMIGVVILEILWSEGTPPGLETCYDKSCCIEPRVPSDFGNLHYHPK